MATKSRCSSAADIIITEDMLVPRPQLSPADVAVLPKATAMSPADVDAVFVRLRALKRSFGSKPNKNELAQALIGACIHEGFDTRARIVAALGRLELGRVHVVLTLAQHEGGTWRCDQSGVYHLLDSAPPPDGS
jgi:hypothetical protein